MKHFILLALAFTPYANQGQSFKNLDFEAPKLDQVVFTPTRGVDNGLYNQGTGTTADILPSWSLSLNGNPILKTFIDQALTFESQGFLLSRQYPGPTPSGLGGNFGLELAPLRGNTYTLSQEGMVPTGSRWLAFDGSGNWSVQFSGATLPFRPDFDQPNRWDISAFAGQTGILAISTSEFGQAPGGLVDSIRFLAVPEPTQVGLTAAAGMLTVFVYLQERKRARGLARRRSDRGIATRRRARP